jgi:two-component system CitB family response regulator
VKRPRVLVVDDDFAVAALHRGFVEAHSGFVVVGTAHTGADAVEAATRLTPDLVLLDIYLPDMTGIDVLRELRRSVEPPVDVIAITAARELETVRAAMAGGVLHYLVKPFPAQVLHERLDDYLRHWEALRRTERRAERLDQRDVDRLLGAPRAVRSAPPVPKGLSRHTLEKVAAALAHSAGDASAREVGDEVGISRVSARRYLEHLVESGQAQVAPKYGAAGRPENRYRWLAPR